jgi:4-amino-4-deoxy-L-arabinose transferase-like glycosyltransferase
MNPSPRAVRQLLYLAIFLIAFGTYVTRLVNSGGLREPPETGDGHDYDAIAFNVWQGRGFGYYWSDEAWREPYKGIPRYRLLLSRQSEYYPTTYRPPAMPFLLSLVYAVTDRSFVAWRIVNCAVMAGAVSIAAIVSAHFAGIPAAIVTTIIALQSRELSRYSAMFMTEAMATFFAALLAWIWLHNAKNGWTSARAAAAGAIMAGLIASRTIFVLWLPLIAILPGKDLSFGSKFAWRPKAICFAVALLVMSPWFVRNMVVTRAFLPLGTQGGINLPMGFGPRAFRSQGIWASNPEDGWPEIAAKKLDVVTSEVLLAQYRSKLTIDWMLAHPREVIQLMRLHVWQELRPRRDVLLTWLLPAAAVAVLVFRKKTATWVIVLMVAANVMSIAMTYSASGRFMVPVQPLLIALAGALMVAVLYEPICYVIRKMRV